VKIEIVAEIAQGYEGDAVKSSLLLKSAAKSGACAAKFQMIYANEISTDDYKFHELFKSLEMADAIWMDLHQQSNELNIELQLDIFGMTSLAKSVELGVKTVKIHPTDVSNISLLRALAESPIERVLLGVGGARSSEIDTALSLLAGKQTVLILGFQGYPTKTIANQIARISLMSAKYCTSEKITIGFADHAEPDSGLSELLGAMSIGAGATLLEKHITLNRVLQMEDHESALNPDEFAKYSKQIHVVSDALGVSSDTDDFAMNSDEVTYRNSIRRHVVAASHISKGQKITPFDLQLKRTSADDPITDLSYVYGKTALNDIAQDSYVSIRDLGE
jgi:N,N'-diacetyllegionaminate synthase